MKNQSNTALRLVGIALLALVIGTTVSCKKEKLPPTADQYIKALEDVARNYNGECPKSLADGSTLTAVTFEGKTMTYRMEISDEAMSIMNKQYLDSTVRDSLIQSMSDKLKEYFIKGDCDVTYKYVSPNDSCSLNIIPKELGELASEEEKK